MKSFRLAGVAISLVAWLATIPRAADTAIKLTDVAAQSGLTLLNVSGGPAKDYIIDEVGNGAAWFDYDNDGHLDVLIVNGSTRDRVKQGDPLVALYRNDGKGHFGDVTIAAGLSRRGWGMGACVADYNNDGFDDVYVTTALGPNVLYRNNGNGTFTDVTAQAGVGDRHWSTGCAFGDYDRDGFVDLYVANYVAFDERTIPKRGETAGCQFMTVDISCGPKGLKGEPDVLYHNNGHGGFTDVTQAAGIKDPGYYGFGVLFTDLDNDGWPDIFVANDSTPNFLFHNNHNGTFTETGTTSGVAVSGDGREQAGMGVDAADYNGDGHLNLVVTHFSHDYTTVYENSGQGFFTDTSYSAGIAAGAGRYMGWGVGFVDFENRGVLDLFVANGHIYPEVDSHGLGTRYLQRKQLFRNLGNKRFQEITDQVGGGLLIEKSSRGAAFADYDNDGDIDVLVINLNDRPTLLRNDTPRGNHFITLDLVGRSTGQTAGMKSNRDAIGARVRVTALGRTQTSEVRSGGSYLSHNDRRAHFGLGSAERVDQVQIRWPSGLVETVKDLAADRFYQAREGQGVRALAGG
jgi:hypothetical protein